MVLTLIMIIGSHGEDSVLDVLVLVHLSLVQHLVKVGRIVILVCDPDTDELGH